MSQQFWEKELETMPRKELERFSGREIEKYTGFCKAIAVLQKLI